MPSTIKRAVKDRNGKMITLAEVEEVEPVNGYIRGMIYEHEVRNSVVVACLV